MGKRDKGGENQEWRGHLNWCPDGLWYRAYFSARMRCGLIDKPPHGRWAKRKTHRLERQQGKMEALRQLVEDG